MTLALTCCAATACSQSAPTLPLLPLHPPPSTTYTGQITDSVNGVGSVRMALTSAAGVTGGTWAMAFGGKFEPTLYINGAAAGTSYTGTLTTGSNESGGSGGCTFTVNATLTDTAFTGSYKTFATTVTCPVARTATFSLIKQ